MKAEKLKRYKAYLRKRIKTIKHRQNELMLRSILLHSQSEELELKYKQVERILEEQKSSISKQIIRTHYNNSFSILFLN